MTAHEVDCTPAFNWTGSDFKTLLKINDLDIGASYNSSTEVLTVYSINRILFGAWVSSKLNKF